MFSGCWAGGGWLQSRQRDGKKPQGAQTELCDWLPTLHGHGQPASLHGPMNQALPTPSRRQGHHPARGRYFSKTWRAQPASHRPQAQSSRGSQEPACPITDGDPVPSTGCSLPWSAAPESAYHTFPSHSRGPPAHGDSGEQRVPSCPQPPQGRVSVEPSQGASLNQTQSLVPGSPVTWLSHPTMNLARAPGTPRTRHSPPIPSVPAQHRLPGALLPPVPQSPH